MRWSVTAGTSSDMMVRCHGTTCSRGFVVLVMKGKLGFIKELAGGLLPTHSEQEIRDHEAWYQDYLQLNDRKKEVIQRWREKKEVTSSSS